MKTEGLNPFSQTANHWRDGCTVIVETPWPTKICNRVVRIKRLHSRYRCAFCVEEMHACQGARINRLRQLASVCDFAWTLFGGCLETSYVNIVFPQHPRSVTPIFMMVT